MITARQIKAARAMLDWSQEELSQKTGLSISTIRNLEMGFISPRGSTTNAIQRVIERAGLEFLGREGICKQSDELYVYQGMDSLENFFDDVSQTVKASGGDIAVVCPSSDILTELCGEKTNPLARLEALSSYSIIKCLLPEAVSLSLLNSSIQLRPVAAQHINPVPYFIYGSKLALVTPEGGAQFQFTVFRSPVLACSYHDHFRTLWDAARPLFAAPESQVKRTRA